MTGMNISEFISKIYYGDEIEFRLGDTTYFVQGTTADGKYFLTVDYWKATDGTEPQHDYLLSLECCTADERKQQFENACIFNGKNIYQAESEIEVLFG